MLITASMSAHDTEAHDIFDGMYRFYKEHTSSISGNLMAWQQSDNGSALINSSGNDSASDGDIDIAYSFEIITSFTDEYKTGLLPDFIIKDKNNNFVPVPADFLESENDGSYYYNSCRCPWRISMDYLISKESRALKYAQSISRFFCETLNGEPMDILAGYTLDGKALEDYNDLCFLPLSSQLLPAQTIQNGMMRCEMRSLNMTMMFISVILLKCSVLLLMTVAG